MRSLGTHLIQPRSLSFLAWGIDQECGLSSSDGTAHLEETRLRAPRSGLEIVNPLTPEINWDWVEAAFKTSVTEYMKLDLADMPILVAESCFTASRDKEKLVELMFERLETPACFIASDAMLNSFCAGRPTSLVVDVGGGRIQVTPVVDGYTLRNAVVSTTRGGRWLEDQIAAYLASQQITVTPRYELRGLPDDVQVTDSFRQACVQDVLRDIKHTILRVPEKPLQEADREAFVNSAEPTRYELPDGTTVENTYELVAIAEQLFHSSNGGQQLKRPKPSAFLPAHAQPIETDENSDGLQELIYASVGRSDVDTRRELLNTITFCGGGSLLPGLGQRLQEELGAIMPTVTLLSVYLFPFILI
jgi:actin-related protein